jgi:hypothetical protein
VEDILLLNEMSFPGASLDATLEIGFMVIKDETVPPVNLLLQNIGEIGGKNEETCFIRVSRLVSRLLVY